MPIIGPPSTTVTVEDTDNSQGWTTISSEYDASGLLSARTTVMDNGSTNSETFFGPQRVSQTITDTSANDASWSSRTTEWDWLGQKTARTTEFDDGDQLIERFDTVTGTRTTRIDVDGDNDKPWSFLIATYDADTGGRIGTTKVLDNGRIDAMTFDAETGNRTSRTITDGGDDKPWHSKTLVYDADTGALTSREIIDDDGSSDLITFQNGRKATQTLTDGDADTFDWITFETTYDGNGRIALTEEVRDDGDLIVSTYAGGRQVDQTTYDNSGNEAWHVEEVSFDAAGDVIETIYYDEAGNILIA
ncbi:hypothetical protein [uncultured Tateyamaria sp.]|uniref:hypothetical protein n=1 Tax=uncultured Tateyamaria sp. TaxID=455651 RepID=UPI0026281FDA|nr:hypothetical protein [uncultured Tateyamaria sp.]